MRKAIVLGSFFILLSQVVTGQNKYTLSIKGSPGAEWVGKLNFRNNFQNDQELKKEKNRVELYIISLGYPEVKMEMSDSTAFDKRYTVYPGKKYTWKTLQKGNLDPHVQKETGFKEKQFREAGFDANAIQKLTEKILTYYENRGYPFVQVKLDSLQVSGEHISGKINIKKNKLILFDSIVIHGDAKVSPEYFSNYTGISPGDPYNESLVRELGARLKEIPFARESKPFRVLFFPDRTRLEIWLEKKKSSRFDGIIGMSTDKKTNRLRFTGEVNLFLQNSIGKGEFLDLKWRSLQPLTQDLKVRLNYPFLFKTKFGADASFKLLKKDTSYLEVDPILGIQYQLKHGNYFRVFTNQKRLSLLSTSAYSQFSYLPPNADINVNRYGLGFRFEHLDYRLNPSKGYSLNLSTAAGNKIIIPNSKLNEDLYANLDLKTVQYNGEAELEVYFPITPKHVIKTAIKGGSLFSDHLFQNELYRLGGLHSIRGFDEESILATTYGIFTLEYRFRFEQNSYLYFFGDGAYYENYSMIVFQDDMPFGFGTGISFETKAGIFTLSYALGKQFSNPVLLRSGKVHFGIVTVF